MENHEKKDNKRPFVKDEGQKFYFNEEGKLVVESNKGIWVDGEPYVKMYGNFQCNAKTLGIIINKFNGCPVVVKGIEWDEAMFRFGFSNDLARDITAIVNPTDDDKGLIRQNDMLSARNNNLGKQVEDLKEEIRGNHEKIDDMASKVCLFNAMPWWKRMFKKVEI